jgi:uncharacterized OB-fold protein
MTPGVTIWRCANCQAALFPERLLCPRCHGGAFETEIVREAVVEEVSTIRHMVGQENWQPRKIASVRVADGLRITVGLLDEAGPGSAIELLQDGEAPFGRAR